MILPDLNAGCSMADMADLDEVEEAWEALAAVTDIERLVPITYMNSSAALKAFVGRHGGAVCTSTNARAVLEWAFRPAAEGGAGGARCCSSPTSTSAATPAWPWATPTTTCGCGTRASSSAASPTPTCKEATFLLWKGHCSVHQRFRPEHVEAFRAEHPDGIVVVHPECSHEVCELADQVGSTDYIIRAVEAAPDGLGHRRRHRDPPRAAARRTRRPGKTVVSLDPLICPCSTMFRIDAAHLCWVLEKPRRGPGRQPHHRRRRHRRVGARSPSTACSTIT